MSRPDHRWGILQIGARLLATSALLVAVIAPAPATAAAPPGRGIEKVTPDDKGDAEAQWVELGNAFPAADGSRFVYNSFGVFAGARSGALNQYLAERGPSGWESRALTAPGLPDFDYGGNGYRAFACADCSTVIGGFRNDIDPQDTNYDASKEIFDLYTTSGDGRWAWVSRGSQPETDGAKSGATSADGSTIGFTSTSALEPEAAGYAAGATIPYLRRDGRTTVLGLNADGVPVSPAGGALIGGKPGQYGTSMTLRVNAISADGSSVVLTGDADYANHETLYLQRGSSITRIDRARCTGACDDSTGGSGFLGATSDHARIFFSSDRELLDGLPAGTLRDYVYRPASDRLELVVDQAISANTSYSAGALQAWSQDGSRTFVTSGAVLTSTPNVAGQLPVAGARNLYMIDGAGADASATFIATSAFGKGTSPNGRYLTYGGTGSYDPPRSSGGLLQTYLFDAVRGTSTCVSCGSTVPTDQGYVDIGSLNVPTAPTDDGTMLFGTFQPLDPHDDNGTLDAYLWEDGAPHLLGSGHETTGSQPEGMSADGLDVYFATRERLVASDTDGFRDVYDARRGGGFPDAPARVPACSGDACQGSAAVPPAPSTAGTNAPRDDGNAVPPTAVGKVSVRAGRSTRTAIKVTARVPAAGGVTVSGARIVRTSRRVARAGSVAFTTRLTAAATRVLRRRHRLTVPVTVSFTPLRGRASKAHVDITIKG